MIVVYVELWPQGKQELAQPLGSLGLADVTQPGDLLDSYHFEIDEAPAPHLGVEQLQKVGLVQGHNRKQSVWKLVRKAIDQVFPNIVT